MATVAYRTPSFATVAPVAAVAPTLPVLPPAESDFLSRLPNLVRIRQLGFGEYDCTAALKIMTQLGYDGEMVKQSKLIHDNEYMSKHDVELLRLLMNKRNTLKKMNLFVNNLVFTKFNDEKKLDK